MLAGFDMLAGVTGLDILSDIIVHLGPVEHSVHGGVGSFDALMSRDGCVMMVMEDLGSEFPSRNTQTVLVIVKVAFLIYRVVGQERGWAHFLDWKVSEGFDDVFKVWVLGDGVFDLGLKVVDYLEYRVQL